MTTTAKSETSADVSITGRTVLVTGAGSGIGAGIAVEMAKAGATVIVNDYDELAAKEVADNITADGYVAHAVAGDITDDGTVQNLVDACQRLGDGIDVLVNNAGITGKQHFEDIDAATWNRVLSVNLTAPFALSAAVIPGMKARGHGRIINIASIAGIRVSVLGGAAYTASKAGVLGLTRHLASELAPNNITVNAILPGVTLTPLVEQATDEASRTRVSASVPLGRMGTPTDIGRLAVFLAGESSSYITGVSIPVDGGMTVLPGDYTEYRSTRGEQ
ncbi:SDR family oxidoreductase [Arthrobacter sp. FW305-123]|nr:SDR family oxidoreductase [Arthrobacter sp. FW305-123]